jgi:hypothetical protein
LIGCCRNCTAMRPEQRRVPHVRPGRCEETSPEDFVVPRVKRYPIPPEFPVALGGINELHASFLIQSRTRDMASAANRKSGYFPLFCEMSETRTLIWVVEEFGMAKAVRWRAVESHISQKTSEIWGTQDLWSGQCLGVRPRGLLHSFRGELGAPGAPLRSRIGERPGTPAPPKKFGLSAKGSP